MESTRRETSQAHRIADLITAEIESAKTQPDTPIASIGELQSLHNAGRPTIKQAVRILQERGVAYMRRGTGGGLLVAPPNPDFASRGLSIQIERHMNDMMDVGPLPMAIDFHLYLNEAPGLQLEQCRELRQLAQRLDRLSEEDFLRTGAHRQLFNAIRTVSGEPLIALAQRTGYECALDLIPYSVLLTGESRNHPFWKLSLETVEALMAGNPAHLFYCLRRQVAILQKGWDQWAEIAANPNRTPHIGDRQRPEFQAPRSRADRLVREILREIRQLGWTVGERIGSGVELMERYRTTPDTLRQAILLLQEHGVVEAERGRSGGLYIAEPDRAKAVSSAQTYLARSNVESLKVRQFMLQLVLQCLEGFPLLKPDRLKARACQLAKSLAQSPPASADADFWAVAVRLCDNPVLSLFAEVAEPYLQPLGHQPLINQLLAALAEGDLARGRRVILTIDSAH